MCALQPRVRQLVHGRRVRWLRPLRSARAQRQRAAESRLLRADGHPGHVRQHRRSDGEDVRGRQRRPLHLHPRRRQSGGGRPGLPRARLAQVSQSTFSIYFNFCIFVLSSVLKKALIHKFT